MGTDDERVKTGMQVKEGRLY